MTYRRSSHSVYDIEYHIVFCTKYRYRVLYSNIAERCIEVIREICSANYIDIISGNVSPVHVHMPISAPPHLLVSKVVQYIKGNSSRKLQCEFQELKKRYFRQPLLVLVCFLASSVHVSIKEVHKYIKEHEEYHKKDSFKISES